MYSGRHTTWIDYDFMDFEYIDYILRNKNGEFVGFNPNPSEFYHPEVTENVFKLLLDTEKYKRK